MRDPHVISIGLWINQEFGLSIFEWNRTHLVLVWNLLPLVGSNLPVGIHCRLNVVYIDLLWLPTLRVSNPFCTSHCACVNERMCECVGCECELLTPHSHQNGFAMSFSDGFVYRCELGLTQCLMIATMIHLWTLFESGGKKTSSLEFQFQWKLHFVDSFLVGFSWAHLPGKLSAWQKKNKKKPEKTNEPKINQKNK